MKKILKIFLILSLALFASPVLAKTITVTFDQAPTAISVEKAPLKYNKDFAFSFGYDDTYHSAYDKAFKYLNGGYVEVDSSYYPGLYSTDGAGNDIPFRGSYSWVSVDSNLDDFHVGSEAYISWDELDESYEAGWDVLHHGWSPANHSASTTGEIVNGIAWVASSTSNNIQLQHFVVPGGVSSEDETAMIEAGFANGIKSVMKNGTSFHFNGQDYLASEDPTAVNSLDLTNYYMSRDYYYDSLYGTATSTLIAKIDSLASDSGVGNNLWRVAFSHRIRNADEGTMTGNFSWDQWKYLMDYIEENYGKSGDDSAWVAGPQEVFEYISSRDDSSVTSSLTDNVLTITLDDAAVDTDLRRKSLSLLVSGSNANISSISYGEGDFVSTSAATSTGLINLDWGAAYTNNLNTHVENYVAAAESAKNQDSIDLAQTWIDFLADGATKTAFQNRADTIAISGRNWKIDFGYNSNSLGAWNEVNVGTLEGSTVTNLHDDNDTATSLSVEVVTGGANKSSSMGQSSGDDSGLYPDIRMQYGVRTYGDLEQPGGDPEMILKFAGFTQGKTYNFKIFGSTTKTDNNDGTTSVYTVGDSSAELQNSLNTSNYVTISGISPDANGEILFSMRSKDTANWKYSFLNVLEITESANTAPRASYNSISQQNSTGRVNIYYKLKDREGDANSINLYEYSLTGDFSGEEATMTAATGDDNHSGLSSLTASSTGSNHYFVWDAQTDLGDIATSTVYVRLRPTDGSLSGNSATSTVFSLDFVDPVLSSIATSTASTTATINWNSDENADSQVYYGITTTVTASTTPTETKQSSHSVLISGLQACSKYYYKLKSADEYANSTLSELYSFTTSGCLGGATVLGQTDESISNASTTTKTLLNTSVVVPSNSFASSTATLQIIKLDHSAVLVSAPAPNSKSLVNESIFDFSLLSDENTKITSFDEDLTITMSYDDADVSSLDESSLAIYYWDGSAWSVLSSCSVDTSANTVSCSTNHFSVFALFGSAPTASTPAASTTSSGFGLPASAYLSPQAPNGGFQMSILNREGNRLGLLLEGGQDAKSMAISENLDFAGANLIPYSQNYTFITPQWADAIYARFYTKYGISSPTIKTSLNSLEDVAELSKEENAVTEVEELDYKFSAFLSLGMKNPEVQKLQERLKELGYFSYPTATGYFGPITAQAVKDFQRANNIDALGYVGPETRDILNGLANSAQNQEKNQEKVKYVFNSFLSLGMKNPEVQKLQEKLKELGYFSYPTATGYFGPVTVQAVKDFQGANGIESVGYVGPQTRGVLNSF